MKSCERQAPTCSRLCRTRDLLTIELNLNTARNSYVMFTYGGGKTVLYVRVPVYRPLTSRAHSPTPAVAPSKVLLTSTSKIMVNFCTDYSESLASERASSLSTCAFFKSVFLPSTSLSNALQNIKPHCVALLSENKESSQWDLSRPPTQFLQSSHINSVLPLLALLLVLHTALHFTAHNTWQWPHFIVNMLSKHFQFNNVSC